MGAGAVGVRRRGFEGGAGRGAEGVGRATTNAVVAASVAILAANFVLTGLFFE